jgi:hypothetical protein
LVLVSYSDDGSEDTEGLWESGASGYQVDETTGVRRVLRYEAASSFNSFATPPASPQSSDSEDVVEVFY